MIDLLIPILTFISVVALGSAAMTTIAARNSPLRARLRKIGGHGGSNGGTGDSSKVFGGIARIGDMVSSKKSSPGLSQRLAAAGFHQPSAGPIFIGSKVILFVGALAIVVPILASQNLPLTQDIFVTMLVASSAFFVPNICLHYKQQSRRSQIQNHLPDAIDLLEICVTAGMGMDMAWNAVADEFRGVYQLLADEMALTNLEIHLGAERGVAINNMAERTGADELSSLVAVLVQTERYGTGVSEALRTFATDMRERRSQRAEETAEKMAVKMLFPLVVLIFPVMLIVAVGPAGITLTRILGG